jgi:serine protease Do
VRGVVAHFPGGPSLPARLVGHDPSLGIALLKADLDGAPEGFTLAVPDAAPKDSYHPGRFVLSLGYPFGKDAGPAPLLGLGILAKRHPDDAVAPWRGQWQADIGATDANVGGAVVDLEGRFVGILTIWSGVQHGRNSGIAFVVPWGRVQRALPDLAAGKARRRGYLGVRFGRDLPVRVSEVVAGSPAERAGVAVGDVVVRLDREPLSTVGETMFALGQRWEGDRVTLHVRRGGRLLDLPVRLAAPP